MENTFNNNWFVRFLINPEYRIHRHLSILLYIGVVFYDPYEHKEFSGNYQFYIKSLWTSYLLLMVYINMYVLIPHFLFKGKHFSYLFSLILITMCCYLTLRYITENYFDAYRIAPKKVFSSFFREILAAMNILTLMVFASTSIKLFQRWVRDNTRISELENTSLQMELKELKNQINPHFLFNMLNNVNVLVKSNPDKASLVILKLSDFLRYQLYDNHHTAVPLLSEIQFLNDFMDLENIRRDGFNHSLKIESETQDNEVISKLMLPPNLFTTFVENAIKHSVDPDYPSQVNIIFSIYEKQLTFMCINTKPSEPIFSPNSGLGLANINRRLELLYGKDFKLELEDSDRLYKVTLRIPV
ncbi:sensor histidine kinase [Flavobacterium sp. '19STA2R22 D10 B1']|uniref:sensor histidine kinase n=1 Tax=Flavobacterium aerium TaxID=3037261 RepID=UPI00278C8DC3|nr:histidine kinase [Flavobacterium sp. '19STA2R22 D10 B1']